MTNDEIAAILRGQAWQRAKGELNAVRQTYYDELDKFNAFDAALNDFITLVEENGWTE